MATIIDIADSVVTELNGASFSQPVSAVRHYAPKFDIAEMETLHAHRAEDWPDRLSAA